MKYRYLSPSYLLVLLMTVLCFTPSCKSDETTIKPTIQNITASVYASGVVVSKNQYRVFALVSGIVEEVFVEEGSAVKKRNCTTFY